MIHIQSLLNIPVNKMSGVKLMGMKFKKRSLSLQFFHVSTKASYGNILALDQISVRIIKKAKEGSSTGYQKRAALNITHW